MKTLRQIGYSIFELATNLSIIDDDDMPIELIYDMVHDVRAFLIDREFKKFRRIDSAFYTVCDCLEVKCREITCVDDGKTVGSGVMEYYSDVPYVDNSFGYDSFKYLGTPDYSIPYRYLNYPLGIGGTQTRNEPGFMFVNGQLKYKNHNSDTKVLTIAALTKFGNCTEGECDQDKPYNVPGHLIHELEGLALKRLGSYIKLKKDEINNTKDDAP